MRAKKYFTKLLYTRSQTLSTICIEDRRDEYHSSEGERVDDCKRRVGTADIPAMHTTPCGTGDFVFYDDAIARLFGSPGNGARNRMPDPRLRRKGVMESKKSFFSLKNIAKEIVIV